MAKLDAKLLSDGSDIQVATLMGRHNVSAAIERLPSQRYIVSATPYINFFSPVISRLTCTSVRVF